MRILVTGASGFLGQKLCNKLLEHGYALMGTNQTGRSGINTNALSVKYTPYRMGEELPRSVIDYSPEILVHLAWDGIPDFSKEKCLENVKSQLMFFKETDRLLDLKKILVAGTCYEYAAKVGACVEAENSSPNSYISWAKQILRDYLILSCQKRAIKMLWFRIFYVYGPGQRAGSLIPTLIKAFKTNTDPVIRDPSASNDFIYIDDVISAFVKAIENKNCCGTFNIGSGQASSVAEIIKHVEQNILNSDRFSSQFFKQLRNTKKSSGMWADISLTTQHIDWKPKTSLAEGIKHTCKLENYE